MLNDSEIQNQITHNYAITLVTSDFGCFVSFRKLHFYYLCKSNKLKYIDKKALKNNSFVGLAFLVLL